jgi:hypothetical protein
LEQPLSSFDFLKIKTGDYSLRNDALDWHYRDIKEHRLFPQIGNDGQKVD